MMTSSMKKLCKVILSYGPVLEDLKERRVGLGNGAGKKGPGSRESAGCPFPPNLEVVGFKNERNPLSGKLEFP